MNWAVIIIVVVLVAVAAFLVRTRYWQLGPCPRCKGRRGRGRFSTDSAYNRRCRCGGSGERIRPLSLIWAPHRTEARRRRDEVKRSREKQ